MRTGRPRTLTDRTCAQCGKQFRPYVSTRRFCGQKCYFEHKRAERVNAAENTAKCAKCRKWKPLESFVKGRAGKPHSYCKPCSSDWFAARRGVNPEKRRPYRSAFKLTDEQRKANKRAANHMAHQKRRAAGPAPHRFDIEAMLCEQDAKCAYCRQILSGPYHIDHKTPVSRGGTNDITNLHLTCPRCNMRKGAMTHEEFLASKKRRVTSWK